MTMTDADGWVGPARQEASGPSVLFLSTDGPVADTYRAHLPSGWRFSALASRDDLDEQRARLAEADVVIHTDTPIPTELLDHAPRLQLVQRQGVGVDALDLDALEQHGVSVAICPHGTPEAVADHTLLLMLAAGRHLVPMHDDVTRRHRWPKWDYRLRSLGLSGATVGIIGFGRIGQAVAERLLGFGSDVVVHRRDGTPLPGTWPPGRVRPVHDLDELFAGCDVVSLHCPLTPETRGMVDARRLALMPSHGILVNTARGGLVVQSDLVDALRRGVIRSAGLDCLEVEPPPPDDPILDLPNVVLTPHTAAGTHASQVVKAHAVFANIARLWDGEPLQDQVL